MRNLLSNLASHPNATRLIDKAIANEEFAYLLVKAEPTKFSLVNRLEDYSDDLLDVLSTKVSGTSGKAFADEMALFGDDLELLDHFKVLFNTGETQDALLKYSIKARALSNTPGEQLDLVNAPEFKNIMDDVQVHGESLGSILTNTVMGRKMEEAVNSDMAKYFNQGNFNLMDIPQSVRVDLEDLFQLGYRFIGQATTRRVSNWNPLSNPDYLFVKVNASGVPDKNI